MRFVCYLSRLLSWGQMMQISVSQNSIFGCWRFSCDLENVKVTQTKIKVIVQTRKGVHDLVTSCNYHMNFFGQELTSKAHHVILCSWNPCDLEIRSRKQTGMDASSTVVRAMQTVKTLTQTVCETANIKASVRARQNGHHYVLIFLTLLVLHHW